MQEEQEDWLDSFRRPQINSVVPRFFLDWPYESDRKKREKRFTPLVHPTLSRSTDADGSHNTGFPGLEGTHPKSAETELRGATADTPHEAQFQHPLSPKRRKSMKGIHGEVTGKWHEKIEFAVSSNSIQNVIKFVVKTRILQHFRQAPDFTSKSNSLHTACANLQFRYRATWISREFFSCCALRASQLGSVVWLQHFHSSRGHFHSLTESRTDFSNRKKDRKNKIGTAKSYSASLCFTANAFEDESS